MRRHELRDSLAEGFTRGGDDIALRATAVGDQRRGLLERGKNRGELRHRRRDHNDVRAACSGCDTVADAVDDAALTSEREVLRAAADADPVGDLARLLERQGEGAADQPNADDGEAHLVFEAGGERAEEALILLRR